KVLRDGGKVASQLAADMRATARQVDEAAAGAGQDADGLALIARQLDAATDAYEKATRYILEHAGDGLRGVFTGSVPYLKLAGVAHAGWQMARASLACQAHTQKGDATGFHEQKFATCVFYAAYILP